MEAHFHFKKMNMADDSSNLQQKNSCVSNSNFSANIQKSTQKSKSGKKGVTVKQFDKLIESARVFLGQKDYGKALSYFAYIVHTCALLKDQVHDDFLFAFKNWSSVLAENGKIDDLVRCLEEACKLFPNSAEIANNVGSNLFRLNMFDEAAFHFRRALKLDPQLSSAEENLDSIANLLVERWHFRMLNDKERNQAYRNAIHCAVKRGCNSVLDIGSGTCILSMFAAQSGAKEVFACEMSKTMFDLSLDILSANQMADCVHVINKKSHDLTIPEDMPRRVSLIVTETLDCGLLGEGIISTLTHAKQELLETCQEAQIIPGGAVVYGQLVQCEKIRNYSQVKQSMFGNDISGMQIRGAEISEKGEEPYTTEDMNCTEHVCLSEPFQIMTYNFQTPENYMQESKHDLNVSVVSLGCLDAVMVWFELRLDAQETLSSAPGCSICWEQAVYPCRLPEGQRIVNTGDNVYLAVTLTSSAIILNVEDVIKSQSLTNKSINFPKQDESKLNGVEINENFAAAENQDAQRCPNVNNIMTLPYQDISKLNDVELSERYNAALTNAYKQLKVLYNQKIDTELSIGCIVQYSSPSLIPLFALRAGFTPVVCIANDTKCMQFLKVLANKIKHPERLHVTHEPLESLSGNKGLLVLVVDAVEPSGQLRQEVIQDIVLAKGCVLPKVASIVLPRKIEVWGMLISSSLLCQKSHVIGDDVTLGIDIAGNSCFNLLLL